MAAADGIFIVGAAVGFGGKLIRTVSFFGCTLADSAGFGGGGTAPGGEIGAGAEGVAADGKGGFGGVGVMGSAIMVTL